MPRCASASQSTARGAAANGSSARPRWSLCAALVETDGGGARLVDCLTLWLSNLMHAERDWETEAALLAETLRRQKSPVVLVTNEVGLGIVPDNALARRFRDAAGILNQMIARVADEVEFVVAGLPMRVNSDFTRIWEGLLQKYDVVGHARDHLVRRHRGSGAPARCRARCRARPRWSPARRAVLAAQRFRKQHGFHFPVASDMHQIGQPEGEAIDQTRTMRSSTSAA